MPWSERGEPATGAPAASTVEAGESRSRERAAAILLGWFHLALGLPVMVGAWWSPLAIDRWLSVAAATLFAAVGLFFLWLGRRLARTATDSGWS
jgi:hypothetical protein